MQVKATPARQPQVVQGFQTICFGFADVGCCFFGSLGCSSTSSKAFAILPHKQNDTDGLSKHACLRSWKRLLFRIVLLHRQRQGSMMNFENLIKVAKRC